MNEYEKLNNYLREKLDNDRGSANYDAIENTSLWILEEGMGADHFSFHSSPGFRSGHTPLLPLRREEIKEILSVFCL